MHLNHKPGEVMQVDWAGDTAAVIDTDTGEIIPAYVFVATLPYSGYSYVEAFFSMNQDSWTTAHVECLQILWQRYTDHPVRQSENRRAKAWEG
ncbi:transposase [human gut metagenome]|uniref:Transposase n=1 Tax=human gut metagenome TaxID=408170 RepID=K1TJ55_9ZZZZ